MSKKEFRTFQEEIEHDYHIHKRNTKIKKWILFIVSIPIILIALVALAFLIMMLISLLRAF